MKRDFLLFARVALCSLFTVAVASGDPVLAETEKPVPLDAGYVKLGLTPQGGNWLFRTNGGLPQRLANTAVWTGSELIVWGGYSNSGDLSDTWSYVPYGPKLRIFLTRTNSAVVAWPVWSIPFTLQQTSALTSGKWDQVNNPTNLVGSEYQSTISPPTGNQFFRLQYP